MRTRRRATVQRVWWLIVALAATTQAKSDDPPDALATEYFIRCLEYRQQHAKELLADAKKFKKEASTIRKQRVGGKYKTKTARDQAAAKLDEKATDLLDLLDSAVDMGTPYFSPMSRKLPLMEVGAIPIHIKVKQIINDGCMLADVGNHDHLIYLPTVSYQEGSYLDLSWHPIPFFISGTQQYETVAGAARTVRTVHQVSIEWLAKWNEFKQEQPDLIAKAEKELAKVKRQAKAVR